MVWGAYLRFIVIRIGTYLINFWEIKLAGSIICSTYHSSSLWSAPPKQAAEHEKEKEEREEAS